jgi:hypothetical protein
MQLEKLPCLLFLRRQVIVDAAQGDQSRDLIYSCFGKTKGRDYFKAQV